MNNIYIKSFEDFNISESESNKLSIEDNVLIKCTDNTLTSIVIPNTVTSIAGNAFQFCKNLKEVNIPTSCKFIGNGAFYGCDSLESIIIPNSVTDISPWAFYGCNKLILVTLPETLESIDDALFYDCINIRSVAIPKSVTYIGGSSFRNNNLDHIVIPSLVKEIGGWAFCSCTNLESVTIPASVTSIGGKAFDKCPLKDLDLITALLITKLSDRDVMNCVKKDLKLSKEEQYEALKVAKMHNVFDLVKPYINEDLWYANRGSRGVLSLED